MVNRALLVVMPGAAFVNDPIKISGTKLKNRTALLLAVAVPLCISAQSTGPAPSPPDCLFSFSQGPSKAPIQACEGDAAAVGSNPKIKAVMSLFGIPHNLVAFKSCPGGRFAAMPDRARVGHFIVQYPADSHANYIAPVAHELGHVFQMRIAGGLEALNTRVNSRKIELGADFLAGLAFNQKLSDMSNQEFEFNLKLLGSYEQKVDDHGKPDHRTQAFRIGHTRAEPYPELSIAESLDYFYQNHLSTIVR